MRKLICLSALLWLPGAYAEPLNVAVASNLTHTMAEISAAFYRDEGSRVNLTFGSSGNFARQIVQGAPYTVFISAGKQYVDFIHANNRGAGKSKPLAHGILILYIPETARLETPATLAAAIKILRYSEYRRLAMANPEHAPYGQAAKTALINAGLWVFDQKKLLLGENAAQAMQFCLSGSVDLCIVPNSFLTLPQFTGKGTRFQLPQHWHPPIVQYAVLLGEDNEQGLRYYEYLSSRSSSEIFKKYGYHTGVGGQESLHVKIRQPTPGP